MPVVTTTGSNIYHHYPLEEYNVVFITLDACRYDTFINSRTSDLDKIGKVRCALTGGTYTLTAHINFFVGYLPTVLEEPFEPYYSTEIKQLWRLNTARYKSLRKVGILLEGLTILQGYEALGFTTIGVGGTGWFRSPILRTNFSHFLFFGPHNHKNIWRARRPEEFALNHIQEIVDEVGKHDKWFLFINCVETHAPYDTGNGIPEKLMQLYSKYREAWGGKIAKGRELKLSKGDLEPIHRQQMKSLEILSARIGKLFAALPKERPLLIVICGDHGEGFGEKNIWGHGLPVKEVLQVPLIVGFRD